MSSWYDRIVGLERRYVAIDGGSGGDLLCVLPTVDDRLRPTSSPRHADLLLVAEPVTRQLLPAILETYSQLAPPQHVGALGTSEAAQAPSDAASIRLEEYLPVAFRVDAPLTGAFAVQSAQALARAASDRSLTPPHKPVVGGHPDEEFIALRTSSQKEIATEDVIINIGPAQNLTAGPLRLLLLADGEQIVRAEVRSEFARRNIDHVMANMRWSDAAEIAATVDPLAPMAARLAYVQAAEQLYGIEPEPDEVVWRAAALAVECAASHLFWLARFAEVLAYHNLLNASRSLAIKLAVTVDDHGTDARLLTRFGDEIRALHRTLAGDRFFALQTRGVGYLDPDRARAIGASGPILAASLTAEGDAFARTLVRLADAADKVESVARNKHSFNRGHTPRALPDTPPPAGSAEAHIEGPRGKLTLHLESAGGETPARAHWLRPSAVHLSLIPELVTGCTLSDLVTTIASLDLSMAEADG